LTPHLVEIRTHPSMPLLKLSVANPAVLTGIGLMLIGVSLFPLMNTFAKSVSYDFPLWQVTWARFTGHLLLTSMVFIPQFGLAVFKTQRPGLQFIRSTIFFFSNACFIGALPWVSLATASAIMFTAPIIVTALSVLFLGERVGVWRWGAVIMGFAGVLVIVQPGSEGFEPATLLVAVSASLFAVYQLMTRRLVEVDSPATQIIYTALVGTVVTSCIVPFVGRLPDTGFQVFSFMAIGTIGAFAHLLVIQALRRAPASIIAPVGYVELVSATILGFLVFGDLPGWATWTGASLIVVSGLIIAWREGLRQNQSFEVQPAIIDRTPEVLIFLGGGLLVVAAIRLWL